MPKYKKITTRSTKRRTVKKVKKDDRKSVTAMVSMGKRVNNNKVYRFVKSYDEQVPVAISAGNLLFVAAKSFSLSDLPEYTYYTNIYDQYRLIGVKQKFIFGQTVALAPAEIEASQPNFANAGIFYFCVDYDDASSPTSVAQILNYQNSTYKHALGTYTTAFKPRVALAAYSGAFTSYANTSGKQWMDCNSPNVEYYGSKWAIDYTGFAITGGPYTMQLLTIISDYVVEFRNVR